MFQAIEDDQVMIIMQTKEQQELLQKHGKFITIDATHKTTRYPHQLVTVQVVDPNNHGQCTAWCLTTSENETNLKVFAAVLRNKGDVAMETMMSDDTNAAFNAFKLSFPTLQHHYLCQWHIQQRWRRATKGATAGSKSGYMDESTPGMQCLVQPARLSSLGNTMGLTLHIFGLFYFLTFIYF